MIICVICGEFMSFVKLCGTLCYSVVNRTNPPFRLLKQNNSCTFADQSSWPVCRVYFGTGGKSGQHRASYFLQKAVREGRVT